MWQIIWDPPAARNFDDLPDRVRESVYEGLLRLVATGRGDLKRLKGRYAGSFRLRVGDYRVRFDLYRETNVLLVLSVEPRGSAYRD